MRSAYSLVPWLAPLNTPAILSTSGLGTGGGAGINTADSGGFGDVNVFFGVGATTSGNVVLAFPSTPPTLFISTAGAFGTVTQATVSNNVTISWTGAKPSPGSKIHNIHYEWRNPNVAN